VGREYVLNAIADIEELAKQKGLDCFPTIFEFVDRDLMLEACSYGLPARARHWSYGRSYQHQKLYGEMGFSKVYEIVFNNNPAYAFLMNTNTDIVNIMVGAHVLGHNHFFKNNVMFKNTDRNMIFRAAERARRVDKYIEDLGLDKVEHLMDVGFALHHHIDWHKGVFRKKYPKKSVIKNTYKPGEFDDLLKFGKSKERCVKYRTIGEKLPPHPEKDLLWFLTNYAPLEDWEKDILEIIREESYYFYPIAITKIINEGYSSFIHAELMNEYDKISEEEFLEFAKVHSGVVSPGQKFSINPYYLGFKIFTDIKEKWDKMHERGESNITGIQKVIQVANEEDDASFLRNYLTKELARKLGLFNYGYKHKRKPNDENKNIESKYGIIEFKDRDLNKIIENILRPTFNYGVPLIQIVEVDGDSLILRHTDTTDTLDVKYCTKTMEYIYELWGGNIELHTHDNELNEIVYYFDEGGFSIL